MFELNAFENRGLLRVAQHRVVQHFIVTLSVEQL